MMMRCSGVTSDAARPVSSAKTILRIVANLTDSLPMATATINSTITASDNTASITANRLAVSRSRTAVFARLIRNVVVLVIIVSYRSAIGRLENLRVNVGGHLLQAVN